MLQHKSVEVWGFLNCKLLSLQDGSVGKGTCIQVWRPEFDPWTPRGVVEREN